LTKRRLRAKALSRKTTGPEQATWEGLQSSFKILINSFYGYLGFGAALFNDFHAAGKVTLAGQRHIKSIVASLKESGGIPIEVDTDGVYFVPPPEVTTEEDELAYIDKIGSHLPAGIRLAHDGHYKAMLSLQLKNYALLDVEDHLILKGSALRSRRLEPCFRDFIRLAANAFMTDSRSLARDGYFDLAERIRSRDLDVTAISQWAMVHDRTIASQPRLKRLLARQPGAARSGERLQIYEREDGELALLEEYAHDENVSYLLRRLNDTAGRFEPLFGSKGEFSAFFPVITTRTDIAQAKAQTATTQLSMF
jgi:DNA polymerase, archaea type